MDGDSTIEVKMTTATQTCPSLEEIAAYVDGMLAPDERARVAEHLARCPSCYELFADAARLKLDLEEEDRAARGETAAVVSIGRRRPVWRHPGLAAAAGIILAVGSYFLYQDYQARPEISSGRLVAEIQGGQTEPWSGYTTRGPGNAASLDYSRNSFQAGVFLVDFYANLVAGTKGEVKEDIARTNAQNAASGLCGVSGGPESSNAIARFFCGAVGRLDRKEPLSKVLSSARDLEKSEFPFDDIYYPFGQWTEAGRLAALGKQEAFFRDRKNQRYLRWLLSHASDEKTLGTSLDANVAQELRALQPMFEAPDLSSPDLPKHFETILDAFD